MTEYSTYLVAKRTVDDRALNRRVWDQFVAHLYTRARGSPDPVRVLEVGAGVGSMVARLAEWESIPGSVAYHLVDVDDETIAAARELLPMWLADAGYQVEHAGTALVATSDSHPSVHGSAPASRLKVSFEVADAASHATPDGSARDPYDAVIAAAFLDIVDLERMLPALRELLQPDGVLYAPCTFDGETTFSPAHPSDDRIERWYHRHMDEMRDRPGSSRAGRVVLDRAPAHGLSIEAVGGCDWVVRPRSGSYPHDEATFLRSLLDTIDNALADYPADTLDPTVRRDWIETRRRQLGRGDLSFSAHHLDILASPLSPSDC